MKDLPPRLNVPDVFYVVESSCERVKSLPPRRARRARRTFGGKTACRDHERSFPKAQRARRVLRGVKLLGEDADQAGVEWSHAAGLGLQPRQHHWQADSIEHSTSTPDLGLTAQVPSAGTDGHLSPDLDTADPAPARIPLVPETILRSKEPYTT